MPLYLVRWPNLDLALVQAKNEDDLKDILDEVADPASATWQVYRGPLYIGFKSQIKLGIGDRDIERPLLPKDIHLSGIQEAVEEDAFHVPEDPQVQSETSAEMYEHFLKKAFPRLYRMRMKTNPDIETIDVAAWEKAVMAELKPLFAYQKRAHEVYSGDDPGSQLLKMAGVVELTPGMQEAIQQGLADEEAKRKVKRIREMPDDPSPRPRDGQRVKLPGGRRRG